MSQFVDTGTKSFNVNAGIGRYLFVEVSAANTVAVLGAGVAVGNTLEETFDAGDPVAIWLASKQGSVKAVSGGALTAGAVCGPVAGGKVTGAGTGYVALEDAAGADEIVEITKA